MCRFLLRHGADVDQFSYIPDGTSRYTATALEIFCNEVEMQSDEPDEYKRVIECRKLLLDYGCDPMIHTFDSIHGQETSPMQEIFYYGVPVRAIVLSI
jgi:hypothetical protein